MEPLTSCQGFEGLLQHSEVPIRNGNRTYDPDHLRALRKAISLIAKALDEIALAEVSIECY